VDNHTFEIVADTIVEECAVPREKISLDSHIVDDLGLDSIAFLDLCYGLDVKFDIKIPFEEWVNDINSGKINSKDHFIVRNLVNEINKLVAQRDTARLA
jgi:acyl carrier protein